MAAVNPNFPDGLGNDRIAEATTLEMGSADVFNEQNRLLLQMVHFQRENIDAADAQRDQKLANLLLVEDNAKRLQTAAKHMTSREKSTRTLQPLTRLPLVQWGNNIDVAAIRLHSVKMFDGMSTDSREVYRWLGKMLSLAKTHTLTFEATIALLINAANVEALDFINELSNEGKNLQEVIQGLELRYGDLC